MMDLRYCKPVKYALGDFLNYRNMAGNGSSYFDLGWLDKLVKPLDALIGLDRFEATPFVIGAGW